MTDSTSSLIITVILLILWHLLTRILARQRQAAEHADHPTWGSGDSHSPDLLALKGALLRDLPPSAPIALSFPGAKAVASTDPRPSAAPAQGTSCAVDFSDANSSSAATTAATSANHKRVIPLVTTQADWPYAASATLGCATDGGVTAPTPAPSEPTSSRRLAGPSAKRGSRVLTPLWRTGSRSESHHSADSADDVDEGQQAEVDCGAGPWQGRSSDSSVSAEAHKRVGPDSLGVSRDSEYPIQDANASAARGVTNHLDSGQPEDGKQGRGDGASGRRWIGSTGTRLDGHARRAPDSEPTPAPLPFDHRPRQTPRAQLIRPDADSHAERGWMSMDKGYQGPAGAGGANDHAESRLQVREIFD